MEVGSGDGRLPRYGGPGVQSSDQTATGEQAWFDTWCDNTYIPLVTTTLRDEIRQQKPFESLEQEAMLGVMRTAAVLGHSLGELLREHGLTAAQYNVLRILRGAGGAALCRHEIADRLVAQVPDVTRLLDRLVEVGLTARERDAVDRRQVLTRITPAGTALLATLDAPVAELHRRALGHLGAPRLRQLIELLSAARGAG